MRAFTARRCRKSCGRHSSTQSGRSVPRWLLGATALLALAPALAQETITYTYDPRGRLVGVNHGSTGPNAGVTAGYTYDNADNRTNVTVSGAGAAPPSFSINDASATEGGTLTFTITRSGATSGTDTVQYATGNNTAVAGSDYTAKALTTLTFNPGVATQTISVASLQDSSVEGNETFYVNLSNPSAGSITDGQGIGTIVDDDTPPPCSGVSFSVSNASANEGSNLSFTVSKAGTTSDSCSVTYGTSDNTAKAGTNYTAKGATLLTFASGTASQTVSVATIDDHVVTGSLSMYLNLSAPSGAATISDSQGVGTINNTDTSAQTIQLAGGTSENLRTIANNNGYTGSSTANYTFVVGSGIIITGSAGSGTGIDTGSWPSGVTLALQVNSNGIVRGGGGSGGAGGSGLTPGAAGGAGGDAIRCNVPIAITVSSGGTVQAGGGGGGGGGGATYQSPAGSGYVGGGGGGGGAPNGPGGAAGASTSTPASPGAPGTTSTGGAGGSGGSGPPGGNGGTYATAGSAGSNAQSAGGAGGAAGYAVRKNGTGCTVTGTVTGTVG